ncbi:MAG: hypothetical protein Q9209_001506 [Squamulea sp. 1 TL-2023]
MDTLMDTLMASALQRDSTSNQTTPEAPPMDIRQFPSNAWRAEHIKRCFGYTKTEYNNLYSKVEGAMRHSGLLEVGLTGQRKTRLSTVLDGVLSHNDAPTVPDHLRMKALHQLAIRINHNVKTRSGHVLQRKKPQDPYQQGTTSVTHQELRRPRLPPGPATVPNLPNPPSLQPPPPDPPIMQAARYCGLGSMLLFTERDDHTQSTCLLKHIARHVRPGAPITVDHVNFDAWKSLLEIDGVLRGATDDVSITWKWGERHINVPNERVLRTVIEFMSTHGGFIEFYIKSSSSGEAFFIVVELLELT